MTFSDEICAKPSLSLGASTAIKGNPLDVFERLSIAEHREYDRVNINELHIGIVGMWCEHDISLIWNPNAQQIELVLPFDNHAPSGRIDDMYRLLSLLNERLDAGHFDFWRDQNAMVYRNALCLAGDAKLNIEQAMALIANALDAAERGYPACQYVVWAGKTPEDALDTALLDLAAAHG